ncbi:MAG TPA: Rad52/Rad22 family DNA repair protein [Stellaceae bacterium]|nr:Rad52/Rad22 family DNA repair protein [Stellaceae bacterium]
MPFSDAQVKLLSGKLNEKDVKTRQERGKTLSYIEGWHAIAEANRVFGFEGWDRETVVAECIWQDAKREPKACAYAARVRIRVRAGDTIVCREGSGVGHGTGATLGDAHESALKEAETDATKRALATFGNLFGLALYDKEQNGVRRRRNGHGIAVGISWALLSGTCALLRRHELPESFCGALRELLERTPTLEQLQAIWARNAPTIAHLRTAWPDLKTANGTHYTEVLQRIYEQRSERLQEKETPVHEPEAPQRSTSELPLAMPRRARDADHLRFVAAQPCLVCGRTPSHAHHVRFAQPRALGAKVSDEFTVPLCFLHHRSLHDNGSEEHWWQAHGTDPLREANRLWEKSRAGMADAGSPVSMTSGGEPTESAERANATAADAEEAVATTAE